MRYESRSFNVVFFLGKTCLQHICSAAPYKAVNIANNFFACTDSEYLDLMAAEAFFDDVAMKLHPVCIGKRTVFADAVPALRMQCPHLVKKRQGLVAISRLPQCKFAILLE